MSDGGEFWRGHEERVRNRYLEEPWGKFLDSIGYDPYDMESAARDVARHAVDRIEEMRKTMEYALGVIKDGPAVRSLGMDYAEMRLARVLAGQDDPGVDREALDTYLAERDGT